jgi:DNA-binding XRE family transcriptional regulator
MKPEVPDDIIDRVRAEFRRRSHYNHLRLAPRVVDPSIGAEIIMLRQRRGWSQNALARNAGLHHDTISMIERGLQVPRPDTLRRIMTAIGDDPR